MDNIVVPQQKTVSLCNFGPQHGKSLCDGSGRVWVERYSGKCVAELEVDADDLLKVTRYMNDKFGKPTSSKSDISRRITIHSPAVEHKLSHLLSIPRTTQNHQFFLTPSNPNGVYIRRYWCRGCPACKRL